jgi:uncharacterized protein YecT (DUF1311 family)
MPSMNLSTLSGPELRRLLDTARARGQAQLTYQILQEMEARRAAGGRPRGLFRMRRRNAKPMALVLDDPPEDPEDDIPPMPLWGAPTREPDAPRELPPEPLVLAPKPRPKPARTPSAPPSRRRKAAPAAAPAPEVAPPTEPVPPTALTEPPRPRSVWDAPSDEPPPPPVVQPPPPRRFSRGSAAFFAVGMAAGVVVGVGASELWRNAPPPAAPAPAAVETAALAPPSAPVVPPPVAPQPTPGPAATDAAMPAVAPPDPPPETAGPALELPLEPELSPDASDLAEAPRDDCAARSTPADRTICGDPELQQLQQELRRAYAQALDAHQDRDVLRQRQLAWRDARSAVSNRDRLARLYEDRIRRLNAATEAARRAR